MDENKNKHTVACYIKKEKDDSKRIKKKINNCNPFAGASNYHLTKQCQAAVCLNAKRELRLLGLSLVKIRATSRVAVLVTFSTKSNPARRA